MTATTQRRRRGQRSTSTSRSACCWAHVTRKVPRRRDEHQGPAKLFGDDIRRLYDVEREADEAKLDPEGRVRLRRQKSWPILAQIISRIRRVRRQFSDAGNMAKAMNYVRKQWRSCGSSCVRGFGGCARCTKSLGRNLVPGDPVFRSPGGGVDAPTNNAMRLLKRVLEQREDHASTRRDPQARHPQSSAHLRVASGAQTAWGWCRQRLMGHSDPKLTAQVYTHLDVEDLRKAVDSVARVDEDPGRLAPGAYRREVGERVACQRGWRRSLPALAIALELHDGARATSRRSFARSRRTTAAGPLTFAVGVTTEWPSRTAGTHFETPLSAGRSRCVRAKIAASRRRFVMLPLPISGRRLPQLLHASDHASTLHAM